MRLSFMQIVGFDIIQMLVDRELRDHPPKGETLQRRISAWRDEITRANWNHTADVRAKYGRADFVGDKVVFDICGNNYRLVVVINYLAKVVQVRFAGNHAEYDAINVRTL
jgi:mRNA interferase HigB